MNGGSLRVAAADAGHHAAGRRPDAAGQRLAVEADAAARRCRSGRWCRRRRGRSTRCAANAGWRSGRESPAIFGKQLADADAGRAASGWCRTARGIRAGRRAWGPRCRGATARPRARKEDRTSPCRPPARRPRPGSAAGRPATARVRSWRRFAGRRGGVRPWQVRERRRPSRSMSGPPGREGDYITVGEAAKAAGAVHPKYVRPLRRGRLPPRGSNTPAGPRRIRRRAPLNLSPAPSPMRLFPSRPLSPPPRQCAGPGCASSSADAIGGRHVLVRQPTATTPCAIRVGRVGSLSRDGAGVSGRSCSRVAPFWRSATPSSVTRSPIRFSCRSPFDPARRSGPSPSRRHDEAHHNHRMSGVVLVARSPGRRTSRPP